MARMGKVGGHDIETEELIVSMWLENFMTMAGNLIISWMEDPYMEKILKSSLSN